MGNALNSAAINRPFAEGENLKYMTLNVTRTTGATSQAFFPLTGQGYITQPR